MGSKIAFFKNMIQNKFYINKYIRQEQDISVSLESKKKILFQMKSSICKIYLKNNEIGIGFLCKFPFNNNVLPALFINSHILNNIDKNKYIKLKFNDEAKEIKMDNSRKKYIRYDKNIDIAIIEIKPNRDKIYNYLELDENAIYQNEKNIELENKKEQYILYIIKMKKLMYHMV